MSRRDEVIDRPPRVDPRADIVDGVMRGLRARRRAAHRDVAGAIIAGYAAVAVALACGGVWLLRRLREAPADLWPVQPSGALGWVDGAALICAAVATALVLGRRRRA